MPSRDPLSVEMDTQARQVLMIARQRLRNKQRGPLMWIPSPRSQFRRTDKGGLTATERAWTRACYYLIFKVPRNNGQPVHYSLTMDWDLSRREPSSNGRLARPVRMTLHKYGTRGPGGGKMPPPGSGWIGFQSTPGNRIDS